MNNEIAKNWFRFIVMSLVLSSPGCGQLLGLDGFNDASPESVGTGGQGGSAQCEPMTVVACYDGPPETQRVGLCQDGKKSCDAEGTAYGACQEQVTPTTETCSSRADENCDGYDCVLWTKRFGNISDQSVQSIAVDKNGNIIAAGTFNGTLTFDPEKPLTTTQSALFITKLTPNGTVLWSKAFEGSLLSVAGLATDSKGNIAMAGTFFGSLAFGGDILHTPTDRYDQSIYVAKFSPEGEILWGEMYQNFDQGTLVAPPTIDNTDHIVLFGTGYCDEVCGAPNQRFWLQKYDSRGDVQFTKSFPTVEATLVAGGVTTDADGNVFIAGSFWGMANLGGATLTSQRMDAFVAQIGPTGDHIWSRKYGDSGLEAVTSIALDMRGRVVVAGTFSGSIDFGGRVLTSANSSSIFLAELSGPGGHEWSTSFDAVDQGRSPSIAVDKDGNVVIAAAMIGATKFGGGVLKPGGGLDVYLAKFGPDGTHSWSKVFGDDTDQIARGVAVAPGGEIALAVDAQGTINLGDGERSSVGGFDIVLGRFGL